MTSCLIGRTLAAGPGRVFVAPVVRSATPWSRRSRAAGPRAHRRRGGRRTRRGAAGDRGRSSASAARPARAPWPGCGPPAGPPTATTRLPAGRGRRGRGPTAAGGARPRRGPVRARSPLQVDRARSPRQQRGPEDGVVHSARAVWQIDAPSALLAPAPGPGLCRSATTTPASTSPATPRRGETPRRSGRPWSAGSSLQDPKPSRWPTTRSLSPVPAAIARGRDRATPGRAGDHHLVSSAVTPRPAGSTNPPTDPAAPVAADPDRCPDGGGAGLQVRCRGRDGGRLHPGDQARSAQHRHVAAAQRDGGVVVRDVVDHEVHPGALRAGEHKEGR